MADVEADIAAAVAAVRAGGLGDKPPPAVALILGSGLGDLADEITTDRVVLPYASLPGFATSAVAGHKNQLVYGVLAGVRVIAQQGRFHYYEGIAQRALVFPLRVMHALGAHSLIVTNAAGGVNADFAPGQLMLITDHINMMGDNPLVGPNVASLGPRFNDMSFAYTPALAAAARARAAAAGMTLREGVYCGNKGPCYETPAEVRMARVLGADAVGMSTVPEVIAASHMSMRVLGISCITNMAAGILPQPLDHSEVIETAAHAKKDFQALVKAVLPDVAEKKDEAAGAGATATAAAAAATS